MACSLDSFIRSRCVAKFEKKENAYSDLGQLRGDTGRDLADSESSEFFSKGSDSSNEFVGLLFSESVRSVLLRVHSTL